MSIVHVIDKVTAWAQANVCDHIQLKQPPEDLEDPTGAAYRYQLVTPRAFPLYVPTEEKLPPSCHSPFPSLCVRFLTGEDSLAKERGAVDLQFCFSIWDTGLHGRDIFLPGQDRCAAPWTGEEADVFFRRTGEGWRDAWNFVDIALRAVERETNLDGLVIDRTIPIKFGPLAEQEAIPDLYPTWFAWISFRVTYPLARNQEEVQTFL